MNKHNCKVISISNHKGGVGKTTSTINIGAALTILKQRVLLIDLDAQSNLTQSLGVNSTWNIYGALKGDYKLQPVEVYKGLEVVPSTLDLSGAEIELINEAGREYLLKELIEPLKKNYDYILIDCPPNLSLLTVNSFAASDLVLIPLQAHFLALQGLAKLTDIIDKIKARLNKKLRLGGVFVTQYDHRKNLNRDILETIQAHFKTLVLHSNIRDNITLAEAPIQKLDIFRYNNKSKGAIDYLDLAKEIKKIK